MAGLVVAPTRCNHRMTRFARRGEVELARESDEGG